MIKLKKIKLDYDRTYAHFYSNLNESTQLARAVLKKIKDTGFFYTFLNNETTEDQIYDFDSGGIAPRLIEIFPAFLLDVAKKSNSTTCFFDAVNFSYEPSFSDPLFLRHGRYYGKEIYYQVKSNSFKQDVLSLCYDRSYAIYYSLCVISNYSILGNPNTKISPKEIQDICNEMSMFFLLAYDGESCIIWDKENRLNDYTKINQLKVSNQNNTLYENEKKWLNNIKVLHPDLKHNNPIGPHWDYIGPQFPKPGIRIKPDGTWSLKG